MVYTLTLNPSLDYVVSVDNFSIGKTNRTSNENIFPGGKGINVSIMLNNLGIKSKALGFVAGFTGEEIEKRIEEQGIKHDFVKINKGISRINLKLKNYEGTEINGQGPEYGKAELDKLFDKLKELKEGDILVLAGSIPKQLPTSIYRDIMGRLKDKGVLFVVDATGELLLNALEYNPFLIKPNNYELGEIFGVVIDTMERAAEYAMRLKEKGAINVLVSMGGAGAVLITAEGRILQADAPKGKVVNTTGAGDSMLAGFITGYMKNKEYSGALKLGIAAGSATAFSEDIAGAELISASLDSIQIMDKTYSELR